MALPLPQVSTGCFAPRTLEGRELKLSMQALALTGNVCPGGARLLVTHEFESAEDKPLEVVYAFALPRDAALRRFVIKGEGFEVHSELKVTEQAVKTYEEALAEGSLTALARQHGDGIINLAVGNLRPKEKVSVALEILAGVESRDDGFRFRFPFTLAPGYHRDAKMAQVSEGVGEIELPSNLFGDMLLPNWHADASNLHRVGFVLQVDGVDGEIGSPSHPVRVKGVAEGKSRVTLGSANAAPDRDLILDARVEKPQVEILGNRRDFLAIVPSTAFGTPVEQSRSVVFLIDRSGSMEGDPMSQARKAVEACLAALNADDSFGIVAFDDKIETFKSSLVKADKKARENARKFVADIHARGGTELARGVEAAAKIAGPGGEVFVLTDGQVFGTESILDQARTANVRLHLLGIGSASQDRFITLLARDTGGVSRFVSPQERVDMEALELFASIGKPIASEVKVSGASITPDPPTNVYTGTPLVLYGKCDSKNEPTISWKGGSLTVPIPETSGTIDETVRLLRGARLITDFESRNDATGTSSADKRQQDRIKRRLLELSEEYQLASREMSLVAVVKREGDKPGEVPVTRVVPVGVPAGVQPQAYFSSMFAGAAPPMQFGSVPSLRMQAPASAMPGTPPAPVARARKASFLSSMTSMFSREPDLEYGIAPPAELAPTNEDRLIDAVSSIEPDGGMPGKNDDQRIRNTIATIFALVQAGHSVNSGAFRSHMQRLVRYLTSAKIDASHQDTVNAALNAARSGTGVKGDWIATLKSQDTSWSDLDNAVLNP